MKEVARAYNGFHFRASAVYDGIEHEEYDSATEIAITFFVKSKKGSKFHLQIVLNMERSYKY